MDIYIPTPLAEREPYFIFRGHKTNFKSIYEKDKYKDGERKKWIDGDPKYPSLTPKHYWFLTQSTLKSGTSGQIIKPKWRQSDMEVLFPAIDHSEKIGYDLYVTKAREYGITSVFGNLPMYYIQTNPGCITGVTSCDVSRIGNMFNEKLIVFYENMDEEDHDDPLFRVGWKLTEKNRNNTKSNSFIRFNIRLKESNRVVTSEILCPESSDNPKCFSGSRLKYLFIDEFGIHKKMKEVIQSAEDSLAESGIRTGFFCAAGTIESGISQESLSVIQELLSSDTEKLRLQRKMVVFLEGWRTKYKYQEDDGTVKMIPGTANGWDNEEFATNIILQRRAEIEKSGDVDKLRAYKKNHPLLVSEVLESVGDGKLPIDLAEKVQKQHSIILRSPPIFTYDLTEGTDNGYVAKQRHGAPFLILKMPHDGVPTPERYIICNDPIPYGDANISDGSDDCTCVFDTQEQEFVAIYKERNLDADYTTNKKIALQRFYHNTKLGLEMNRGEVVFQKYKDRGILNMLAMKPLYLGFKKHANKANYGIWRDDPRLIDMGNALLFDFIRNHISRFMFKEGCEQLLKFLMQNNDIVDTMIWVLIYNENNRRKINKLSVEEGTKQIMVPMYQKVNGRVQIVNVPLQVRR